MWFSLCIWKNKGGVSIKSTLAVCSNVSLLNIHRWQTLFFKHANFSSACYCQDRTKGVTVKSCTGILIDTQAVQAWRHRVCSCAVCMCVCVCERERFVYSLLHALKLLVAWEGLPCVKEGCVHFYVLGSSGPSKRALSSLWQCRRNFFPCGLRPPSPFQISSHWTRTPLPQMPEGSAIFIVYLNNRGGHVYDPDFAKAGWICIWYVVPESFPFHLI